jgi:hypothetical protein
MPFYILLPGMKDPSLDLLRQALKEMAQHYNRPILGYRLMWFLHILRRTDTMPEQDKHIIEEELDMLYKYDELVQEDPVIQRLLAQSMAEGEKRGKTQGFIEGTAWGIVEGEARGEIKALKEMILSIVSIRFSSALAAQAQSAVMSIQDYEVLKRLHRQLLKAVDEQSARLVLDLPDEQDEHLPSASLNE